AVARYLFEEGIAGAGNEDSVARIASLPQDERQAVAGAGSKQDPVGANSQAPRLVVRSNSAARPGLAEGVGAVRPACEVFLSPCRQELLVRKYADFVEG